MFCSMPPAFWSRGDEAADALLSNTRVTAPRARPPSFAGLGTAERRAPGESSTKLRQCPSAKTFGSLNPAACRHNTPQLASANCTHVTPGVGGSGEHTAEL